MAVLVRVGLVLRLRSVRRGPPLLPPGSGGGAAGVQQGGVDRGDAQGGGGFSATQPYPGPEAFFAATVPDSIQSQSQPNPFVGSQAATMFGHAPQGGSTQTWLQGHAQPPRQWASPEEVFRAFQAAAAFQGKGSFSKAPSAFAGGGSGFAGCLPQTPARAAGVGGVGCCGGLMQGPGLGGGMAQCLAQGAHGVLSSWSVRLRCRRWCCVRLRATEHPQR